MAILNIGESLYTRSIKDLIKRIHDATPVRDSVYEMASDYYKNLPEQKAEIARIEAKIQNAQDTLSKTTRKPVIADLEDQIKGWKIELKNFHTEIDDQRIKRRNKLVQVCMDILDLLDGANFLEENNRAAKLLGTIFMIHPDEGRRRLTLNGRAKHLYKACLSLRLLDRLLSADLIKDPFIKNRADILKQSQNGNVEMAQATYRDDIKIPLIMACLLQDIGRMHPDAQRILHGPDRNMNEFRTLSLEERTQLLQITSIQTMLFVRDGIGLGRYVGNSREERDQFVRLEQLRLSFILRVIKSSITGEGDIGDLIKIPQIYSSVVLSTKENNQLHQTPLAMMILKRGAESGRFSKAGVAALLSIVGIFPQGFGIAYIPADASDGDRYEYAVVNGLYPPKFDEPLCRRVTRNLQYYPNGNNVNISRKYNLYFPEARHKLEKMSRERLLEILEKLCFDFEERKNQDLIPRCWHPYHYFSDERHQNLWGRTQVESN